MTDQFVNVSPDYFLPDIVSSCPSIMKFDPVNLFSLSIDGGELFAIRADGEIVRGPKFTTEDAASLKFWEIIAQAFPRFLEQVKAED